MGGDMVVPFDVARVRVHPLGRRWETNEKEALFLILNESAESKRFICLCFGVHDGKIAKQSRSTA